MAIRIPSGSKLRALQGPSGREWAASPERPVGLVRRAEAPPTVLKISLQPPTRKPPTIQELSKHQRCEIKSVIFVTQNTFLPPKRLA